MYSEFKHLAVCESTAFPSRLTVHPLEIGWSVSAGVEFLCPQLGLAPRYVAQVLLSWLDCNLLASYSGRKLPKGGMAWWWDIIKPMPFQLCVA